MVDGRLDVQFLDQRSDGLPGQGAGRGAERDSALGDVLGLGLLDERGPRGEAFTAAGEDAGSLLVDADVRGAQASVVGAGAEDVVVSPPLHDGQAQPQSAS
ncbi:hypothetical protein [Streptomyces sp. NPDC007205]|uniref:hypothetical protein n=1 Tax=Streptomyces sp. NPDC007205 TaxID=3154316 RepID=UPI00340EBC1F